MCSHNLNTAAVISVADVSVLFSYTVKALGVTLDHHASFYSPIRAISETCYNHVGSFWHIRPFIYHLATAISVACTIIRSHLD